MDQPANAEIDTSPGVKDVKGAANMFQTNISGHLQKQMSLDDMKRRNKESKEKAARDKLEAEEREIREAQEEADRIVREQKEAEERAIREKQEAEEKVIRDRKEAEEKAQREREEAAEAARMALERARNVSEPEPVSALGDKLSSQRPMPKAAVPKAAAPASEVTSGAERTEAQEEAVSGCKCIIA
jgi:hypothetical protein